jgi:hypothetical protein
MGKSLADGRLCRRRFHSATGWYLALSSRESPVRTRAPARTRWQCARPVCCSCWPLPHVCAARIMSGIWYRHQKATPGQCRSLAHGRTISRTSRFSSNLVGRLEPVPDATRVDAAPAQPAGRSPGGSIVSGSLPDRTFAPFTRRASPLAFELEGAAGSECAVWNCTFCRSNSVWFAERHRHIPWLADHLTARRIETAGEKLLSDRVSPDSRNLLPGGSYRGIGCHARKSAGRNGP